MQVHSIWSRSLDRVARPIPKLINWHLSQKNRPKKAKIGENRRSASVCGPPGPENAGSQPTQARKRRPAWARKCRQPGSRKNGSKIWFLCKVIHIYVHFYVVLYKFLCGLEGRCWLAMQGVPGSKLASARKIFFLFFTFFLDLAKISTKPKVDFRDAAGFYDWKSKFRL